MKFDDYRFEKVAEDLLILNPGYVGNSVPEIVSYMESFAYQYMTEPGKYAGTGGFYVVSYRGGDGEINVTAMLMPGMVGDKLKKADEAIAKLAKLKAALKEAGIEL